MKVFGSGGELILDAGLKKLRITNFRGGEKIGRGGKVNWSPIP